MEFGYSLFFLFFFIIYFLLSLKIIQLLTTNNFRDFCHFPDISIMCLHFLRCIATVPASAQNLFSFFCSSTSMLPEEPCPFPPSLWLHLCWSYSQVQKQTEHYIPGQLELMWENRLAPYRPPPSFLQVELLYPEHHWDHRQEPKSLESAGYLESWKYNYVLRSLPKFSVKDIVQNFFCCLFQLNVVSPRTKYQNLLS